MDDDNDPVGPQSQLRDVDASRKRMLEDGDVDEDEDETPQAKMMPESIRSQPTQRSRQGSSKRGRKSMSALGRRMKSSATGKHSSEKQQSFWNEHGTAV